MMWALSAKALRNSGARSPYPGFPVRPHIAVVAVDPTSPFSGGAVLGDRVRMRDLAGDEGVFIRSMASRGMLGGLALATSDMVQVFDAAGFDLVIIETVGAGQAEIEIAGLAHTTIVVAAPGMGDEVQAIKSGILEIADVLVINKADHPYADNTFRTLRAMLDLNAGHPAGMGHHGPLAAPGPGNDHKGAGAPGAEAWKVPIFKTVAAEGEGVDVVLDAIHEHWTNLTAGGGLAARERARVVTALEARLREALLVQLVEGVGPDEIERTIEDVLDRRIDPNAAVANLIEGARRAARG